MRGIIISTWLDNVGDDLVRNGVQYLVQKAISSEIKWRVVSKYNVLSLLWPCPTVLTHSTASGGEYLSRARCFLNRKIEKYFKFSIPGICAKADIVVVAGSPIFYFNERKAIPGDTFCDYEPWTHWIERGLKASNVPMMTIGIGSIQPRSPELLAHDYPKAFEWIRWFHQRNQVMTVRDASTKQLIELASGSTPPRIPCPSLWGHKLLNIQPRRSSDRENLAVVSFGLESLDWAGGSAEHREALTKTVIDKARQNKMDIVLLCQTPADFKASTLLSRKLGIQSEVRVIRSDVKTLLNMGSRLRLHVSWRPHASMGVLSVGGGSILMSCDNRSAMAKEAGATLVDHLIEPQALAQVIESKLGSPDDSPSMAKELIRLHEDVYISHIRSHMPNHNSHS